MTEKTVKISKHALLEQDAMQWIFALQSEGQSPMFAGNKIDKLEPNPLDAKSFTDESKMKTHAKKLLKAYPDRTITVLNVSWVMKVNQKVLIDLSRDKVVFQEY